MKPFEYILWTCVLALALGSMKHWLLRGFHKDRRYWLRLALECVTTAEQLFGAGSGPVKLNYAYEQLYSYLPLSMKLFLSPELLKDLIEEALTLLKQQLEESI